MNLGRMIFDLVYSIYDFDEDVIIVFSMDCSCRHCNRRVLRVGGGPHYLFCECGKRHMFRRTR